MTAPVGLVETGAAKKGCAGDCERLRGDYDILRRRLGQLENDLRAHQLDEEEAKKPVMWIYECTICGQRIEALGGIKAGEALRCSKHGLSPLNLVSPRPS